MTRKARTWTTKDGSKVAIKEMSNAHLLNALKVVIRAAEVERVELVSAYLSVPEPTAEQANVLFEQELEDVLFSDWEDFVPDVYGHLYDEYMRRGLDPDKLDTYAESITASKRSG